MRTTMAVLRCRYRSAGFVAAGRVSRRLAGMSGAATPDSIRSAALAVDVPVWSSNNGGASVSAARERLTRVPNTRAAGGGRSWQAVGVMKIVYPRALCNRQPDGDAAGNLRRVRRRAREPWDDVEWARRGVQAGSTHPYIAGVERSRVAKGAVASSPSTSSSNAKRSRWSMTTILGRRRASTSPIGSQSAFLAVAAYDSATVGYAWYCEAGAGRHLAYGEALRRALLAVGRPCPSP